MHDGECTLLALTLLALSPRDCGSPKVRLKICIPCVSGHVQRAGPEFDEKCAAQRAALTECASAAVSAP